MHIEWDRKYETGIEKVDEQHRKLVELINNLYERVVLNEDMKAVQDAMVDLKLYTIFHFSTEEKLFKKFEYEEEDQEAHLQKHQTFIDELQNYFSDDKSTQYELGYRLVEFLKKWLFSHILVCDMKFARHLKQNHFSEITADDIYFDDDDDFDDED